MKQIIAIFTVILTLTMSALSFTVHSEAFSGDDRIVVVIDPGHGGKDVGTLSGDQYEKYYNLKVAEYMKAALEANGNFVVHMTRTSDTALNLGERGLAADKYNADILVSIHFNSSAYSSSVKGTEIYTSVLDKFNLNMLAKKILSKTESATGLNARGVFSKIDTASFYWDEKHQWDYKGSTNNKDSLSDYYGIITWGAKFGIPTMIIEEAYLSNASDREAVSKESTLKKLGEANAAALAEYYTGHTHSYSSSYIQDYPASCFSTGKKSIKCSVCGHRKNITEESASGDGHFWIADKYVGATCTSDGYAEYVCRYTANLNDKVSDKYEIHKKHEVIPATGHFYEVTFSQPLTHSTDGITTYTCSVCNDQYSDIVKCEGHNFSLKSDKAPECTETGETVYECTICGEVKKDTSPALGHDLSELSKTPASCTEDGEREIKCLRCGISYKEKLESTGHNYIEDRDTDGALILVCTVCKDKQYKTCPDLKHNMKVESEISPSCTEEGKLILKCDKCSELEEKVLPATGHDFKEAEIKDFLSKGEASVLCKCTLCGEEKTEIMEISGFIQNNGEIVKKAGIFKSGEKVYTYNIGGNDYKWTETLPGKLSTTGLVIILFVITAASALLCTIIVIRKKRNRIKIQSYEAQYDKEYEISDAVNK